MGNLATSLGCRTQNVWGNELFFPKTPLQPWMLKAWTNHQLRLFWWSRVTLLQPWRVDSMRWKPWPSWTRTLLLRTGSSNWGEDWVHIPSWQPDGIWMLQRSTAIAQKLLVRREDRREDIGSSTGYKHPVLCVNAFQDGKNTDWPFAARISRMFDLVERKSAAAVDRFFAVCIHGY